jgi:predicted ATPase
MLDQMLDKPTYSFAGSYPCVYNAQSEMPERRTSSSEEAYVAGLDTWNQLYSGAACHSQYNYTTTTDDPIARMCHFLLRLSSHFLLLPVVTGSSLNWQVETSRQQGKLY